MVSILPFPAARRTCSGTQVPRKLPARASRGPSDPHLAPASVEDVGFRCFRARSALWRAVDAMKMIGLPAVTGIIIFLIGISAVRISCLSSVSSSDLLTVSSSLTDAR